MIGLKGWGDAGRIGGERKAKLRHAKEKGMASGHGVRKENWVENGSRKTNCLLLLSVYLTSEYIVDLTD
jgi:hypothetical protein